MRPIGNEHLTLMRETEQDIRELREQVNTDEVVFLWRVVSIFKLYIFFSQVKREEAHRNREKRAFQLSMTKSYDSDIDDPAEQEEKQIAYKQTSEHEDLKEAPYQPEHEDVTINPPTDEETTTSKADITEDDECNHDDDIKPEDDVFEVDDNMDARRRSRLSAFEECMLSIDKGVDISSMAQRSSQLKRSKQKNRHSKSHSNGHSERRRSSDHKSHDHRRKSSESRKSRESRDKDQRKSSSSKRDRTHKEGTSTRLRDGRRLTEADGKDGLCKNKDGDKTAAKCDGVLKGNDLSAVNSGEVENIIESESDQVQQTKIETESKSVTKCEKNDLKDEVAGLQDRAINKPLCTDEHFATSAQDSERGQLTLPSSGDINAGAVERSGDSEMTTASRDDLNVDVTKRDSSSHSNSQPNPSSPLPRQVVLLREGQRSRRSSRSSSGGSSPPQLRVSGQTELVRRALGEAGSESRRSSSGENTPMEKAVSQV